MKKRYRLTDDALEELVERFADDPFGETFDETFDRRMASLGQGLRAPDLLEPERTLHNGLTLPELWALAQASGVPLERLVDDRDMAATDGYVYEFLDLLHVEWGRHGEWHLLLG